MDTQNSFNKEKLLKRIIVISAVFAMLISVLIIANYLQLNRHDPVNTEIINSLVERLNDNPNDESLRVQIREFDLLARKAYFTNQWQVRTGGYLLLISIAVMLISFQMLDFNKRKHVIPDKANSLDVFGIHERAQKGVLIVSILIFTTSGVLVFLTNYQLGLQNTVKELVVVEDEKIEEVKKDAIPKKEIKIDSIKISTVNKPAQSPDASGINETDSIKISTVNKPAQRPDASGLNETDSIKISTVNKPVQKPDASGLNEKISKVNKPDATEPKKLEKFTSFRGEGGLGIAYSKNVPTDWDGTSGKNIKWQVDVPIKSFNSPIIWGNKIFLSGANKSGKEVYCYNRVDGKMLWRKAISGIEGSPTEAPKTTSDTGLAAPTLTTDGKRVYAVFADGDLVALDLKGNIVWTKNLGLPKNHYGHSSSLILFKETLLVQFDHSGEAKLIGINSSTGETKWETPRNVKISWSSPIIINKNTKPEVILVAEPTVASYDPVSGKENWAVDCIFGEVGPSAAYADGIVYALNEYASLVAIKIGANPEVIWEGDMLLSDVPSPVAHNGLLLVSTSYGAIACHDAKTGDIYWEQDFGSNIYSSPMLVGDNIYLMDTQGVMHIFKMSKTYEEVASPKLGVGSVCTPAFADGYIYIRAENKLFAIGG